MKPDDEIERYEKILHKILESVNKIYNKYLENDNLFFLMQFSMEQLDSLEEIKSASDNHPSLKKLYIRILTLLQRHIAGEDDTTSPGYGEYRLIQLKNWLEAMVLKHISEVYEFQTSQKVLSLDSAKILEHYINEWDEIEEWLIKSVSKIEPFCQMRFEKIISDCIVIVKANKKRLLLLKNRDILTVYNYGDFNKDDIRHFRLIISKSLISKNPISIGRRDSEYSIKAEEKNHSLFGTLYRNNIPVLALECYVDKRYYLNETEIFTLSEDEHKKASSIICLLYWAWLENHFSYHIGCTFHKE